MLQWTGGGRRRMRRAGRPFAIPLVSERAPAAAAAAAGRARGGASGAAGGARGAGQRAGGAAHTGLDLQALEALAKTHGAAATCTGAATGRKRKRPRGATLDQRRGERGDRADQPALTRGNLGGDGGGARGAHSRAVQPPQRQAHRQPHRQAEAEQKAAKRRPRAQPQQRAADAPGAAQRAGEKALGHPEAAVGASSVLHGGASTPELAAPPGSLASPHLTPTSAEVGPSRPRPAPDTLMGRMSKKRKARGRPSPMGCMGTMDALVSSMVVLPFRVPSAIDYVLPLDHFIALPNPGPGVALPYA